MSGMGVADPRCSVCGFVIEVHMHALCGSCGLPYHLNQRSDIPGDDCGQVWINDEFLALEFACNTCLAPPVEAGALDDVLDSSEAATAGRLAEADLLAAAESGLVRHRRTASGVYLFQRGDVLAFAEGRR